tara:strand:+ start:399 stop:839 length:441 start_codon:yes stop_codon:yes gene_type:complete
MISLKEINSKDSKSCYELDLKSIKLWSQNQWNNELKKNYVTAIGIYLNNSILGVCVFHKIFDEAEIRYLSIHPSYKRRGLGKKLIYKIFKDCKNQNIRRVFLEVSLKNKQALSFYNSFGFKTINIRKRYYKDGSDAVLKEKKILNK